MEPFLGEIMMFAGTFAPQGWMLCNGQILQVNQYNALFSLIGSIYGGDGISTFALPDLRGCVPVGTNLPNQPTGMRGGQENVSLASNQVPVHTHNVLVNSAAATTSSPANNYFALADTSTAMGLDFGTTSNAVMNNAAVGATGSGLGHNNIQPTTVISFCIAITGVYPTQS